MPTPSPKLHRATQPSPEWRMPELDLTCVRESFSSTAPVSSSQAGISARSFSLTAARDQFKMSVGAPHRSSDFRLAQLRKLDAMSMSPDECRGSQVGNNLSMQLGLFSPAQPDE